MDQLRLVPSDASRSLLVAFAGLLLAGAFAGCAPAPLPAAILPTATLAPTQVRPTPTATFLPPPTVTPFPTATPGSGIMIVQPPPQIANDAGGVAGEGSADSATQSGVGPGGPAADVPRADLVFITGFEQGWPIIEEPNARIYVSGGEYMFEIGPNALRYLTTTVVNATDMYAQVQAAPQDCPVGAGYGLFFRLADASNYYALTFFCDNRVMVFARSGGSLLDEPLVDSALPGSLNAAERVPHVLGILAQGNNFTVYFDGQAVATFTSDLHERGDVAIYAVSPPNGVLRVAFDNLEVWTVR